MERHINNVDNREHSRVDQVWAGCAGQGHQRLNRFLIRRVSSLKRNKKEKRNMMTTHVEEAIHGNVLEVRLTGKLSSEDYARFVPDTETMIHRCGKIRILAILEDFHGWDAGALWKDIQWDARHFNDIERIAIVGEKRWHAWMTGFCKPFTTAGIRYFTHAELAEARKWLSA
jgi:hypothetical protein